MERLNELNKEFSSENNNEINTTLDFAKFLDSKDELSSYREKFHFPKTNPNDENSKEYVYFCGNSLGLQPKATSEEVNRELTKWAKFGVEGHWSGHLPWVSIDDDVNELMTHVVGAKSGEVAIMNSLTANLNLLLITFYRPTKDRFKILVEGKAFPSDRYSVESHVNFHNYTKEEAIIELHPRENEFSLRTEDILDVIDKQGDEIALVMMSGVQYYTGQFFNIPLITSAAHKKGCKVGFDLAHAVGNVPLKLHDWNVDFAVWCNYKYMNSGPGAIGGIFVNGNISGLPSDLPNSENKALRRLQGWWGSNLSSRFTMTEPFDVLPGAYGFRQSNPSILALAAVRPSAKIFVEVGIDRLRQKSFLLTGYMEYLMQKYIINDRVVIITPKNAEERGCQLSVLFVNVDVETIYQKLIAQGIIVDERKPNVIRFSPAPLYNNFSDVWIMVNALKDVLNSLQ